MLLLEPTRFWPQEPALPVPLPLVPLVLPQPVLPLPVPPLEPPAF